MAHKVVELMFLDGVEFGMARPKKSSRYTPKKAKPVHGDIRERPHGDHSHTERWCENHQQWEPVD